MLGEKTFLYFFLKITELIQTLDPHITIFVPTLDSNHPDKINTQYNRSFFKLLLFSER